VAGHRASGTDLDVVRVRAEDEKIDGIGDQGSAFAAASCEGERAPGTPQMRQTCGHHDRDYKRHSSMPITGRGGDSQPGMAAPPRAPTGSAADVNSIGAAPVNRVAGPKSVACPRPLRTVALTVLPCRACHQTFRFHVPFAISHVLCPICDVRCPIARGGQTVR
jgi:hypothetical protein